MKNLVDLIKESFINTDINEYDNYIIEGLNIDPNEKIVSLTDNHNKGCVVYSTRINGHKMNLIPIKGKEYHAYDDGKITFSRHYIAKCKLRLLLK